MSRYAFFGDLKLPTLLRGLVPQIQRGVTQMFQGNDRLRALVVAASPNFVAGLDAICFIAPETKKGFRSREMALHAALVERGEGYYPVCWIDDSTRSKVVGSYSAPTITSNSHGFSNSDRVLIRRAGVGLYTIGTVAGATSNTFTVSANHAILAGDEIHLIEEYYDRMVFQDISPIRLSADGDYYTEELTYKFVGNGSTVYARTTVS
jgi:hypothetical protein